MPHWHPWTEHSRIHFHSPDEQRKLKGFTLLPKRIIATTRSLVVVQVRKWYLCMYGVTQRRSVAIRFSVSIPQINAVVLGSMTCSFG